MSSDESLLTQIGILHDAFKNIQLRHPNTDSLDDVDISGMKQDISGMKQDISEHGSGISELSGNIIAIQNTIQEGGGGGGGGATTAQANVITSNTIKISEISGNIVSHAEDISGMKQDISGNSFDISEIKAARPASKESTSQQVFSAGLLANGFKVDGGGSLNMGVLQSVSGTGGGNFQASACPSRRAVAHHVNLLHDDVYLTINGNGTGGGLEGKINDVSGRLFNLSPDNPDISGNSFDISEIKAARPASKESTSQQVFSAGIEANAFKVKDGGTGSYMGAITNLIGTGGGDFQASACPSRYAVARHVKELHDDVYLDINGNGTAGGLEGKINDVSGRLLTDQNFLDIEVHRLEDHIDELSGNSFTRGELAVSAQQIALANGAKILDISGRTMRRPAQVFRDTTGTLTNRLFLRYLTDMSFGSPRPFPEGNDDQGVAESGSNTGYTWNGTGDGAYLKNVVNDPEIDMSGNSTDASGCQTFECLTAGWYNISCKIHCIDGQRHNSMMMWGYIETGPDLSGTWEGNGQTQPDLDIHSSADFEYFLGNTYYRDDNSGPWDDAIIAGHACIHLNVGDKWRVRTNVAYSSSQPTENPPSGRMPASTIHSYIYCRYMFP